MDKTGFLLSIKHSAPLRVARRFSDRRYFNQWQKQDKAGAAPHFIKEQAVSDMAKLFGISTLVETGTYLGDMLWAQKDNFKNIYSIELDPKIFAAAKKKFSRFSNIHLLLGDSGRVLAELLPQISGPAVFWLDGHYSGGVTGRGGLDTPIMQELKNILSGKFKNSLILIDDARMFVGKDGYPTIDELKTYVNSLRAGLAFEIFDDIIRLTPPHI